MIRPADIINVLSDDIAQDLAIETWCTTVYHRRQIVSVGWDSRKTPSETDCPLIVLRPVSGSHGDSVREILAAVACNVIIHDPQSGAGPTGTRVSEAKYVQRIAEIEQLVFERIQYSAHNHGIAVDQVDYDYQDDAFPYIDVRWTCQFRALKALGAADPAIGDPEQAWVLHIDAGDASVTSWSRRITGALT